MENHLHPPEDPISRENRIAANADQLAQLVGLCCCRWLIAIAYWLSGGFIKSGLGNRIAYAIVAAFGKTTLGLTYSLVFAEALLAPAIPSVRLLVQNVHALKASGLTNVLDFAFFVMRHALSMRRLHLGRGQISRPI